MLDLFVDAPDVLADDAQRDQLDAAEQQHDDDRRRHAALEDVRVAGDDGQRNRQERHHAEEEAQERRPLQWPAREGRDRVEAEPQHPAQRVLGDAGVALLAHERDRDLGEADPDRHATQEAVALGHGEQRIERPAVHQAEVARLDGEVEPGQAAEGAVEAARGDALERALPQSLLADGVDDVDPVAPAREHFRDHLGRVLEVAVEHHDHVTAGVLEPGGQRRLVAEVAGEADDLHPRVARRGGRHRVAGAVLRTVVDEDQLVVEVAERVVDAPGERGDRVLLLIHRGHHAEQPHLAVHGRQGTGGIRCAAMADDGAVERELFEVGRKLAAALPTTRNPLKVLDDKAMDLASSDAELKAALFRFVDVVPACRNLDDLARHLTAFLEDVDEPPPPVGVALKMGNSKAGRRALGMAAASGVKHMAHRFIVGEDPKAALGDLRDLWKDGVASSVDLLGEATVTQAEAQRYADRCADALDTITQAAQSWPGRRQLERDSYGPLPRANLSVKVSALTPLLRPDAPERGKRDAADRLRPLLRRANERKAHLHIDMESMDSRDAILELILEILGEDEFRRGPSAGMVLQGYLRDSPQTLDTILDWAGRV